MGLWFQSLFVGLTMKALSICIMLVVYGRMIEIYLVTSVAPIPMATMVNHEWGSMGQNYLKSLLALGFQAFLILVCVGIYAVLIQTIAATDDISGAIWACMGYTVLLCFTLFKTGSLARASFRHIKGVSYDLKIGLIDVDSHNFPNLCLMKLSAYHKAKGHTVEWWNAKGRYDLVYKSRVLYGHLFQRHDNRYQRGTSYFRRYGLRHEKPLAAGSGTQLPGLFYLPARFSGLPTAF